MKNLYKSLLVVVAVLFLAGCECNAAEPEQPTKTERVIVAAEKAADGVVKASAEVGTTIATNIPKVIDQSKPIFAILAKGMEKAGGYVEQAVDFTVQQAPLVVREYAAWVCVSSLIWAVTWLFPIAVLGYITKQIWTCCKQFWKEGSEQNCSDTLAASFGMCLLTLVGALLIFGCIMKVGGHLETAAKAKFAPRVLLIEKAAELYKN